MVIVVASWSSLLRHGHHCCVMVIVVVVVVVVALWLWLLLCYGHHRGCCIIVVLSWSSWSWLWSCRSHCCVVSTKSRLSRRPSVFWPGVESQNTTIRRIIGIIECDIPPLVIFIVASSHCHRVIIITLLQCHVTLSPLLCHHCHSHHIIAIALLSSRYCHCVVAVVVVVLSHRCHRCHRVVVVVVVVTLLLSRSSCPFGAHGDAGR